MLSVVSILSGSLLVSSPPLTAQDTSLWRYATQEKIEFYRVSPLGDLLVGTKQEIVSLDPETGEPNWTRSAVKPEGFNAIPFTPYGVVRTNDGIAMINLATGEAMWDSTAVPLEKVRGYLTLTQHDMVLVYGETPESKRTIVAVDITTGEVEWRQDTLFRRSSPNLQRFDGIHSLAGHQPPIVDSDTTFILNISKDGPMRIHSRTGELLWRLDLNKRPPLLMWGFAPMLYSDGVLFAPYDYWKLVAVNVTDGSVIWDLKDNSLSRLTQMELTSHGLVVRGGKPPTLELRTGEVIRPATNFFLDLVDAQTGTSVWPTPVEDCRFTVEQSTCVTLDIPFIVDGDGIFVTKRLVGRRNEEFVALDYADGSALRLAEFKFEGGENPTMMEIAATDFLISSNQNFLSVNRTGTVLYHRYYEPPGRSVLENIARVSSAVILSAIGDCANNPNSCTMVSSAAILSMIGDCANNSNSCTMEHPDSVFSRFKNAEEWANFAYLYTKQPDSSGREGFSLVRLDKRNGEEVGRVWIDERRPDYVIDRLSDMVFVKENDKEIVAFKFPGT